jgi:large subunit ribosomal protein L3
MLHGMLGRKLGMTQVFSDDGAAISVTVVEVGPCYVTQVRTKDNDGYEAVQLGFDEVKRLTAAERGHLKGLPNLRHLREFQATDISTLSVGQKIDAGTFAEGDLVDISGISKGKGFQGVVKRHHFAGGPRTHGQSDRHRAPGSIGSGTTPGRVLKGHRMAGHMGNERVTVKNLEVVRVDVDRNVLLVRGAVPGPRTGIVTVQKARSTL